MKNKFAKSIQGMKDAFGLHTNPQYLKDTMSPALTDNCFIADNIRKERKKIKHNRSLLKASLAALSVFCLSLPTLTVQAETVFLKGTAYQSGIAPKDIKVGTSEVIVSNAPIKRVAVTDPSIANVRVLSDTSALVMGRRVGKTSLLIWEGKDPSVRPSRFDLTVKRDISDLIASLKLLDPNIQVDYIMVSASSIQQASPTNSNGAYITSYRTQPETVGDPAPSVVINNVPSESQTAANTAPPALGGAAGGGGERIILSGKVKSPDLIAKAFTIASTYMGVDGNMRIVTRNGGVIVDQITQLLSESDASGGSVTGSQSLSRPTSFTSNLRGNLGNGGIVSNGDGSILSFLEVTDRPQISVMIRFYEVSRSVGKDFSSRIAFAPGNSQTGGIYGLGAGGKLGSLTGNQTISSNFNIGNGGVNTIGNSAALNIASNAGSPGTFFSLFPKQELSIQLQALESRGEVKLLAEPNIVVMSGEPGKFVAGGEVPIQQAVSTLGAIGQQVNFETFGISLNILPTITDNDSILMNVAAQTRDLDAANPFIPVGSNLPAFRTRRADTQVEMDPNNALIIGGLINSSSSNSLSKIPFIGDIPILGALARSKSFARSDSELVIVLAPEIVRAAHPSQVIRPLALENSTRPGQFDYIPRTLDLSKTSIPITAPNAMPAGNPVDLSRPATVNDLDHIYK